VLFNLFYAKNFKNGQKINFMRVFVKVLAGFEKEMGGFNLKTYKIFQNVKQSSNERETCGVELNQPPK